MLYPAGKLSRHFCFFAGIWRESDIVNINDTCQRCMSTLRDKLTSNQTLGPLSSPSTFSHSDGYQRSYSPLMHKLETHYSSKYEVSLLMFDEQQAIFKIGRCDVIKCMYCFHPQYWTSLVFQKAFYFPILRVLLALRKTLVNVNINITLFANYFHFSCYSRWELSRSFLAMQFSSFAYDFSTIRYFNPSAACTANKSFNFSGHVHPSRRAVCRTNFKSPRFIYSVMIKYGIWLQSKMHEQKLRYVVTRAKVTVSYFTQTPSSLTIRGWLNDDITSASRRKSVISFSPRDDPSSHWSIGEVSTEWLRQCSGTVQWLDSRSVCSCTHFSIVCSSVVSVWSGLKSVV